MGLSTTLVNALSGLNAAARGAEVVSSNVANARTPGFARRELNLSAMTLGNNGAGVRIDRVSRSLNQFLLNDRRIADADAGNATVRTDFLSAAESAVGQPGTAGSLSDRLAALGQAFLLAASRPDAPARLQSVVTAANGLIQKLAQVTTSLQTARMDADARIDGLTKELTTNLGQIDRLNADILTEHSSGRDATALMDQRQKLVDRVAVIVPIREVARPHDQVSLYTTGGAILLEGNPATIGFTPVGVITADMTLASGALHGLTINGQPALSTDAGALGGGLLGAELAIRDGLAPGIQTQIDALARDLVARFQTPGLDPTVAPGQPGLFTDAGAPLDPLTETGLAGRLRLNALVDPAQGGALWRLRDGIGATAPGNVGNATLLTALNNALEVPRIPASGGFIGAARSAAGLGADILSQITTDRLAGDSRASFTTARQSTLTDLQLKDGVDTDAELQNLISIEHAYSANARVIKVVDDLMQQLIGL